GARSIVPPRDIPTVGRFAIIADPQGAGVALFRSANPSAPPAGAPANGEFTWFELGSLDADASVAFYTRLFGWTLHDTMPMGPDAAYRMFGAGERTFFAIYPLVGEMAAQATVPPQWLPYVRVADMARSLDAVRQGGGQVLAEPREIPGGDHVARCADPFGVQFALHAAAPHAAA
ncbi:MAG TPA: VOC family protein, partial [Gemmatirosa sp.]